MQFLWAIWNFCLRQLAKDQGITWVVHVVLRHLVHFRLKKFKWKKSAWQGIDPGSFRSTAKNLSTELQSHILFLCKLISITRPRPWTSIGRHLFFAECVYEQIKSWLCHFGNKKQLCASTRLFNFLRSTSADKKNELVELFSRFADSSSFFLSFFFSSTC